MFDSDKPINHKEQDRLERNNFVTLMAKSLLNMKSQNTFTIGLYGEWGTGKTSLINLLLNEIEEQQKGYDQGRQIVAIRFEPWNCIDSQQLLQQFFVKLSNELKNNNVQQLKEVGEALEIYSDAFEAINFIPAVGPLIASFAKRGTKAIGKRLQNKASDISYQKVKIIELLGNQSNKILIIVDDIDRLSSEQIRQVFQLVASVANFPNVIYLLAFDYEIVTKALEPVQSGNGSDYLEKIVQLPIKLPEAPKGVLRNILIDEFNNMISDKKGMLFDNDRWDRVFELCVDPLLKNIRFVRRLCNLLSFKLNAISSEIEFGDMVALTAIEISIPSVYRWIEQNKTTLTGELDFGIRNKSQNDWREYHVSEFDTILEACNMTALDGTGVAKSISVLFPYFGKKIGLAYTSYDSAKQIRYNHIGYSDMFDRYFDLNIDKIGLKKSELSEIVFSYDQNSIRDSIIKYESSGNGYNLLREVEAMLPEIGNNRAEELIQGIIKAESYLGVDDNSIFGFQTDQFACRIILRLMTCVEETKRKQLLVELIHKANTDTLSSITNILNKMDLLYGRLTSERKEYAYDKPLSAEDLLEIESEYRVIAKELLDHNPIFKIKKWRIVYYVLQKLEPDYIKQHILELCQEGKCAPLALVYVARWIGTSVSYEINDNYDIYISKEELLSTIESFKETKDFFEMSGEEQNACAAYYLLMQIDETNERKVSQEKVDELLKGWRDSLR